MENDNLIARWLFFFKSWANNPQLHAQHWCPGRNPVEGKSVRARIVYWIVWWHIFATWLSKKVPGSFTTKMGLYLELEPVPIGFIQTCTVWST